EAGSDGDTDDDFIDSVKKIEEINTEIGMSLFPGMKEMYRSTLLMFYKKLLSECNKMTSFLESKDLENFMISVHSMKSSLATIGAMRLSETAFDLENASRREDSDFCALQFPEFNKKLLSLHKKLSVIFTGRRTLPEKEPGNTGYLRESARKAIAAAENFDSDTGIEIIKNLLSYDFGEEKNILLENAVTALENFEYEGVVEILKKLE
ncbi:MAG: Hpt domain-containing protein, partial [Treponema sp.]|nr:Hpt domain-containing protein [Treponema sp.]